MKSIKKIIKNVIQFENETNISLVSAATSFYVVVAIFSLLILGFQLINYFFLNVDSLLLENIYSIFNPIYYNVLDDILPNLQLNGFSVFLGISLFWSSSKVINGINKVADMIYKEVKRRNGIIIRISSFLMFMMLFCILLFEVVIMVFTNNLLHKWINNVLIFRIIEFLLEILVIFIIIIILYIYVPPVKMTFKKSFYGASITTCLLYILSIVIIVIVRFYQNISISYGALSLISLLFFWIFTINYILILGIVINYYTNKKSQVYKYKDGK